MAGIKKQQRFALYNAVKVLKDLVSYYIALIYYVQLSKACKEW